MRYVAAYLLAVLGGQDSPANADLEKILSSVGIEADAERLTRVIKELKGKSIDDLIKEGREKLSSMPVGGGGAAAATPTAGAPAAAAGSDKKEAKKEEKKEDSESEDDDMGFALFE
ncbi:60S acidic ribosomal protein P2 [Drosophila hydei]|uniref:Large ribosomal subunit protein P2 n=1 Tax=Drosophila hydei TaxID=7224 RepID=A0A6J1LLY3_DROHY|nr:60S acidic ribosomal protein P2 [Drosophila hydei]